jgi:hypothetical protein
VLTKAELEDTDSDDLFVFGLIGCALVAAGSFYDYLFPAFSSHRIFGEMPVHDGLKLALIVSLSVGAGKAFTTIRFARKHRQ